MRRRLVRQLSLLLLPCLIWTAEISAQPQAITVEADRLEMDSASGVSKYRGNVVMTQGSLLLRADRVTLRSQGSKLLSAEASGTPVHLERPDPETGERIKANATNIKYLIPQGRLEMSGNAHLWRGKDEFSGEHIVYELEKRVVRASGKEGEDKGRVKVILQPAKEGEEKSQ